MNSSQILAFRVNLALLVLAVLIVSALGALGMVHLRVEIEQSAKTMRSMEQQVAEMERFERFLDARIAHMQQPRELVALMSRHQLDLRPSQPEQLIYIHDWNPNIPTGGDRMMAGTHPEGSNPELQVNVAVLPSRPGVH